MELVSVNVGLPKTVQWKGKAVETGIFKAPVTGPVAVKPHNLEGDRQADLTVHGGADKAVYGYATEHYDYWKPRWPGLAWDWGQFGENLTIAGGLQESEIMVGDLFQVGTAQLRAVQPRLPCFKLGIRFNDPLIIKQFAEAGRPGVYFRVERAGDVQAGSSCDLLERVQEDWSIRRLEQLLLNRKSPWPEVESALSLTYLPVRLREYYASA